MEAQDFAMPSPKRQRTNSPEESQEHNTDAALHSLHSPVSTAKSQDQNSVPNIEKEGLRDTEKDVKIPGLDNVLTAEDNNMLDTLMQHVESESGSLPSKATAEYTSTSISKENKEYAERDGDIETETARDPTFQVENPSTDRQMVDVVPGQVMEGLQTGKPENTAEEDANLPKSLSAAEPQTIDHLRAVAEVNGLPPTADSLIEEQVPSVSQEKEWETDSSPYDSSDSDSSSDDSSSADDSDEDEDDADGGYTMLDTMEQARILMQDAGSDDEGDRSTTRGAGTGLRTANERVEEIITKPDITVTEEMAIEELGEIDNIVEGIVLVRAKVSGEYQVLESGSVLCLQDRSVIGAVSETLGRVEQPLYTIRFGSETDIKESGVSEKGTKVFYVKEHSTFVFTQPLKAVKGSDASNFHDEEVGDEEMEFSDDEAEAEHKRILKLKRKGIDPSTIRGRSSGRGARGSHRGARGSYHPVTSSHDADGSGFANGTPAMNYDDVEEGETGYTPLQRPTNLHEMMGNSQPVESPMNSSYQQNRGGGQRRRGRGNDGGRGHRGGRGGNRFNSNHNNHTPYSQGSYGNQQQNAYQPPMPPPQIHFAAPPPPPTLTPQNSAGQHHTPFSPSPISPLPKQQFNFPPFPVNPGSFQQQQQSPDVALNVQYQQLWQNWQAQQGSPNVGLNGQFQQLWQNWQAQQQYQSQPQSNGGNQYGNFAYDGHQPYAGNTDAAAQAQQHLDELRRASSGSNGHQR